MAGSRVERWVVKKAAWSVGLTAGPLVDHSAVKKAGLTVDTLVDL